MSDYRRRAYTVTMATMVALFFVAIISAGFAIGDRQRVDDRASSVVKVLVEGGHGSGVHIGDGYVLTATHVVEGKKGIKLKSSFGDIQDAELLWTNKARDVALLRAKRPDRLQSSPLVCAPLVVGQRVTAEGSPGAAEFVRFRGDVAGIERTAGPWLAVVPIDISGGPGISGGPIFDEAGNVAGIYVGVYLVPLGMSALTTGIGIAVPSNVICELMARVGK
jgi:S1-C subfamily serine protease